MSINLGNKRSAMFFGDKFVKNVYLGNKILQPWSTESNSSNIYNASYVVKNGWNGTFIGNGGSILFTVPSLLIDMNIHVHSSSQSASTLTIYVKDASNAEVMYCVMGFTGDELSISYIRNHQVLKRYTMSSWDWTLTLHNFIPFKFTLGSNVVEVGHYENFTDFITEAITLPVVYSGWHFEIYSTNDDMFMDNAFDLVINKFTGMIDNPEQYAINYSQGSADSSAGLPSNVILNRNEEYTIPNNAMTKSPTILNTFTVTLKYNYAGSPADAELTTNRIRKYTANGWSLSSSYSKYFSGGETIINLLSNTYGATPIPSLDLVPYFRMSNGTTLPITLPTPTRSGYKFSNWNTRSDGTGVRYSGGSSYTPASNTTLYAQWQVE